MKIFGRIPTTCFFTFIWLIVMSFIVFIGYHVIDEVKWSPLAQVHLTETGPSDNDGVEIIPIEENGQKEIYLISSLIPDLGVEFVGLVYSDEKGSIQLSSCQIDLKTEDRKDCPMLTLLSFKNHSNDISVTINVRAAYKMARKIRTGF